MPVASLDDLPSRRAFGTLSPYDPSWSERLGGWLQDALERMGASRSYAQGFGERAQNVAGLMPGVGQALSANEAYRQFGAGHPIAGALAGLGAVPIPGAAIEGALARGAESDVAQAAAKGAGKLSWDPASGQWTGGKVTGLPMTPPAGAYPDIFNFDAPSLRQTPDVPQSQLNLYNPPKGVPARVAELVANPDVRSQMLDKIKSGMDVGVPWYNTDPARQQAIGVLGEDAGNAAYQRFMELNAATSPRNPIPSNIRAASYYYWREKQGLPPMDVGDPVPQPYGGFAQKLHQRNVQTLSSGEGLFDPLQNPKPPSYLANLSGNQAPATIDTHAFRLPAMLSQDPRFLATRVVDDEGKVIATPRADYDAGKLTMAEALQRPGYWEAQPKANEYAALDQYYRGLGEELGLTPAQVQASAWVGGGPITGLSSDPKATWLRAYQDRLQNTASRTGMTPEDVTQGFWRGQFPLLGVTGGLATPLATQYWASRAPQTATDDTGGPQPPPFF